MDFRFVVFEVRARKPWIRVLPRSLVHTEYMKTIVCLSIFTLFAAALSAHAQRRPPPPVVTVQVLNGAASEGVDDPGVVVVHRNGGIQKPLRVYYRLGGAAQNGGDYERLSGSVVIPAGSLETAVEIRPIDDDLVEGTERVAFCLKPPPKNAPQYRLGAPIAK